MKNSVIWQVHLEYCNYRLRLHRLRGRSSLEEKGYTVTSTTRNPDRLEALAKVSQKSIVLKGNDEDEWVPLIADNDAIVVTVAADSPDQYESAYLNTSKIIRHLGLEMDLPRHLIYTSSTSVYGDAHGQWVDEHSELLNKSDQGKILIEAEKHYLSLQEVGWRSRFSVSLKSMDPAENSPTA